MKTPLYSLDELDKITGRDDHFKGEMISLFISQSGNALEEISLYAGQKNYQALFRTLHRMKPSVMVMGITLVTESICDIEEMKKGEVNEERMQRNLKIIQEILSQVIGDLKQWSP